MCPGYRIRIRHVLKLQAPTSPSSVSGLLGLQEICRQKNIVPKRLEEVTVEDALGAISLPLSCSNTFTRQFHLDM